MATHAPLAVGTPPGECIVSRPFTIGGHNWRVKYYPNSVHYSGGEHISLYLVLDNNMDKPVKVQFLFNLVVSPWCGDDDDATPVVDVVTGICMAFC
jgi:hypothetical protein